MKEFINELENFNIPFLLNEPLSKHSSFKIGGNAKVFMEPTTEDEISKALSIINKHDIKKLILGKGSNILFSDSGFDGAVLHLGRNFSKVELIDGNVVFAESGASLAEMCVFALEQGLSGMEELYGIPGSVGGAAYMNAGAYGGEVSDTAIYTTHIDADGKAGKFENKDMGLSYRHSAYSDKDYIITGLAVKLQREDRELIHKRMDDFMNRRRTKQPLEFPSAGSTFKRPVGGYASALIDECGLKGLSVGDAEVSKKHAGFIINKGNATSSNVLELIEKVKKEVLASKGIRLECEVRIID